MMNGISPKTTLRELMCMVPDTSNIKLPTAKALRTGKAPILFDTESSETRLIIYANGFFTYSVDHRCTVQSVHKCRENILYEYVDGHHSVCGAELFLDRPFQIRLMLEGDIRLEMNQEARLSSHVYSYDNLPQESADLEDPTNLEDSVITKMDRENLHTYLNQLTHKQQQVVEHYHLRGMTQIETAKKLGISREAVKVRPFLIAAVWAYPSIPLAPPLMMIAPGLSSPMRFTRLIHFSLSSRVQRLAPITPTLLSGQLISGSSFHHQSSSVGT